MCKCDEGFVDSEYKVCQINIRVSYAQNSNNAYLLFTIWEEKMKEFLKSICDRPYQYNLS